MRARRRGRPAPAPAGTPQVAALRSQDARAARKNYALFPNAGVASIQLNVAAAGSSRVGGGAVSHPAPPGRWDLRDARDGDAMRAATAAKAETPEEVAGPEAAGPEVAPAKAIPAT